MNVSIKPLMAVAGFFSALSLSMLTGCGGHGADEAAAHGGGGGGAPSGQPMEVPVMRAQISQPEWTDAYPGRAEGLREVQIRPRVSGILLERVYQEGSRVNAGDVLFKIDPQPYKVALMRAQAELARAEASLREAERNWNRTRRLYESNAISERERDNALSTFELAQAELNVQKAAVEEAKLQLGYTSVESIVPGVTSLEGVPQGSLVDSSTLLATVTQLDPVQVRFSISEADPIFAVLQQHRAEGGSDLKAQLRLDDGTTLQGKVDFAASTVNADTGTVQYRALFENPKGRILPGMFVRVSFADLTLEDVVMVPETSVITSAQGPIVYTVGPDSKVQPRPVQLGPIFGNQQAIVSGLKEGDQILTGAIIRVRPGMPIKPVVQSQNQGSDQGQAQNQNQAQTQAQ